MKPISGDKVRDIVALLMKGKSTRVVARSLDFSQSMVNVGTRISRMVD